MFITVACAGILAEAPELHHIRDDKPSVSCRVLVNRRMQSDEAEWVSDEPTARPAEAS